MSDHLQHVWEQITVQDPIDDSSGSGKEEEYHKDSPVHEASERGDSDGHSRDIRCSGNAGGNEPSVESLEGNIRRSDRPSALKRFGLYLYVGLLNPDCSVYIRNLVIYVYS